MMDLLYVMVLIICAKGDCQPVQVPGEGTQQACLHAAPQMAAEYSVMHPGVTIGGYRCEPAGSDL